MHLMTIIDAFKKSLRAKILLGYFVVIGILMLVGLWTVLSSIAINRAVEAITIDSYRSLAAVHGMLNSLDKMNMAQSEMLLGNDTADNEHLYWEADKGFRKSLSDALSNITYPGEEAALNAITDLYDAYFNGMTNTRAFILSGNEAEAGTRHNEAVGAYNQLMLKLEELYTINQDYMVKSTDNARSITSRAINSASLVSVIGLVVALYLGYKVSDVIIAPTKLLTESARRVESPMFLNALLKPDTDAPCVMTRAMPWEMPIMPNVAIQWWKPQLDTRYPVKAPQREPAASPASTAIGSGRPALSARAVTTPESVITPPIERSIIPDRIASVMPSEAMKRTEPCRAMFAKLAREKKPLAVNENTPTTAMMAMSTPDTLNFGLPADLAMSCRFIRPPPSPSQGPG
ncbi:MAG: Four helix bundle sensory module for signal transduction [Firmicutes bacterium ADurb.Bin153]|nr:MAG: Four helix bundle sensory module for signal transduction [Firmicutes bacterium ADurb.Bin153]